MSSSGVCVGGQTDGYSAEELEAALSLYNGNNPQSGRKMGFSPGQSPNSGEETVETSFMGTAQIQLLCGFASASIPKTLTDGFGHYTMNS